MRLSLLLVAAIVAACELQSPLSGAEAGKLKGRKLAAVALRPAALYVAKPGAVSPYNSPTGILPSLTGSAMTGAALTEAGERIASENSLVDPAAEVAQQLGDELRRRYGLVAAPPPQAVLSDDPTQINVADPSADLVLEVWTGDWTLAPLPGELTYVFTVSINLRVIDAQAVHLIDGKKGIVMAEGSCHRKTPNGRSYSEFLADGARRLKDELREATRSCVDEFRGKLFGDKP